MSYVDDFVERVRGRLLPDAESHLEAISTGKTKALTQMENGEWMDVSAVQAEQLRRKIKVYREIIEAHEATTATKH